MIPKPAPKTMKCWPYSNTRSLIGQQAKQNFVRSKYYIWVGFALFALAISLTIWGATLTAFISVVGFFLLTSGIIEFVFAQQILSYEEPIPWKLVGLKLVISTISATGSVWIMTMADVNANVALLFLGVFFILIGLGFFLIYRITLRSQQLIVATGNWHR